MNKQPTLFRVVNLDTNKIMPPDNIFVSADGKIWFRDQPLRRIELMEHLAIDLSTDLKDTNDKVIYENDILEIILENDNDHGFSLPVGSKVVVKWMDGGFRLIYPEHYHNEREGFCEVCASKGYLYSENHEMPIGYFSKVVSTIYESPELLK